MTAPPPGDGAGAKKVPRVCNRFRWWCHWRNPGPAENGDELEIVGEPE